MSVRRMVLMLVGVCACLCMTLAFFYVISSNLHAQTVTDFQTDNRGSSEKVTALNTLQAASYTLPAQVIGTPLVVENLITYDGAYMEDLSFDEVISTAAIILRNTGHQWIREAEVTLAFGEAQWVFCATELPPGQAVLVLERNRNSCKQRNFTAIHGWSIFLEQDVDEEAVHIERVDMSKLMVSNQTERELTNVQVYYKTVYGQDLFYMGGITFQVTINRLLPNESVCLQPEFLAGDLSRILRVEYEIKDPPLEEPKEGSIL